jgi:transmembrane 9 superfamily protein 2/4
MFLLAFALLGLLSPSNRGFLATAILLISALFGCIGGYVSARAYKAFGGEAWRRNIIMTPLFTPGIIFSSFFILNLFVWAKGSSGAVPFGTMLALVMIWFVISVPLSVAGSWLGFKQSVLSLPCISLVSIGTNLIFYSRSMARQRQTKSPVRFPQWLVVCAPFRRFC